MLSQSVQLTPKLTHLYTLKPLTRLVKDLAKFWLFFNINFNSKMDWFFNLQIPKSNDLRFVIRPSGKNWLWLIFLQVKHLSQALPDNIVTIMTVHISCFLSWLNKNLNKWWRVSTISWEQDGRVLAHGGLAIFFPRLL